MTAIAIYFDAAEAFVACDSRMTTAADPDARHVTSKCIAIPHKRLLIAAAGLAYLAKCWAWSHYDMEPLSTSPPNPEVSPGDPIQQRAREIMNSSVVYEIDLDEQERARCAVYRGPAFKREWLRPGLHVWAAGHEFSDSTTKSADAGRLACFREVSAAADRFPSVVGGRMQCSTLNARRLEQWLLGDLPIAGHTR